MKIIELTVSSEMYNQLEQLAKEKNISVPQLIEELLYQKIGKASDMSDSTFKKAKEEVIRKNDDLFRRLADK
ncbi:MAG: ribbon-helix-helix protein, CopG family [Parachlamydia sp.]|jgi:predicted DNA-binding ribbon-helix-helix protein|nr:ribbon-helix-helix protein, CopG family [Parachlamydia sp.]